MNINTMTEKELKDLITEAGSRIVVIRQQDESKLPESLIKDFQERYHAFFDSMQHRFLLKADVDLYFHIEDKKITCDYEYSNDMDNIMSNPEFKKIVKTKQKALDVLCQDIKKAVKKYKVNEDLIWDLIG